MISQPMRAISEEEIGAFDRDGVVVLRGVLPPGWIARCRAGIDEVFARLDANPISEDVTASARAAAPPDEPVPRGAGRFVVASGAWTWNDDIRAVGMASPLPELAGRLTRSSSIRFYDDQVLVKQPGCSERTAFHTDEAYWKIIGEQVCVIWVPADVVTRDSSAMRYVRGSQRWTGRFGRRRFFDGHSEPSIRRETLPDIEADEASYDIVTYEVEPGDVIAHHYRTVHGSGGNASDRIRRAASIRYVGDDVRYAWKSSPDKPYHDEGHLTDGDPLDEAHYPTVWRRSV
jgi:ectoine hydroxylase-related dioxygenase (phytanoyl-CoA dioxygenase family)